MTSKAFTLLASVTASTKRPPAAASGKIGAAATSISSLKCTPLDPVDAEMRQRLPQLAQYGELLQTFVQGGLDIREGDVLTVSSVDYPIRAVEDWHWRADNADYDRMILERL